MLANQQSINTYYKVLPVHYCILKMFLYYFPFSVFANCMYRYGTSFVAVGIGTSSTFIFFWTNATFNVVYALRCV